MFFNININEVIHNLLYNKNKNNDSLIIVLYMFLTTLSSWSAKSILLSTLQL